MTLFGHDTLVSQETHKRVIPKFVQQMCRQVLYIIVVVVPIALTIISRCYDFIRARPARKARDLQTSNTEVCQNVSLVL
jgi:hypothetical protein